MGLLSSAIRLFIGFIVVAVGSTVFMVLAIPLLPFRVTRIKLCNYYGKIVGRSVTAIAGVKPVIHHRERLDGSMPAIYVMNHASTLDAFTGAFTGIWMCPVGGCGVFKKEIVRVPFFGQIAYLSGHLLLDRFNKDRAVETLKYTAEFVKKNRLGIWIMPEGTRSRDGRLLPFKKGFVHLAIATGFPVVPVVVHGAHHNWEKGKFLQFRPMTLDVDVLPPIDTSSWREETAGEHAQSVHDLFVETVRDDQKPLPAPTLPAAA